MVEAGASSLRRKITSKSQPEMQTREAVQDAVMSRRPPQRRVGADVFPTLQGTCIMGTFVIRWLTVRLSSYLQDGSFLLGKPVRGEQPEGAGPRLKAGSRETPHRGNEPVWKPAHGRRPHRGNEPVWKPAHGRRGPARTADMRDFTTTRSHAPALTGGKDV